MPNERKDPSVPRIKPNDGPSSTTTSRGYTSRPRGSVYWDEIPQEQIGLLVHAITKSGAAIMFGRTSDGGALSLTVLDGDNRIREWPRSAEDFESLYHWLVGMFSSE